MNERFATNGLPIEPEDVEFAGTSVGPEERLGLQATGVAVPHARVRPRDEPPNPIPHLPPEG